MEKKGDKGQKVKYNYTITLNYFSTILNNLFVIFNKLIDEIAEKLDNKYDPKYHEYYKFKSMN